MESVEPEATLELQTSAWHDLLPDPATHERVGMNLAGDIWEPIAPLAADEEEAP